MAHKTAQSSVSAAVCCADTGVTYRLVMHWKTIPSVSMLGARLAGCEVGAWPGCPPPISAHATAYKMELRQTDKQTTAPFA